MYFDTFRLTSSSPTSNQLNEIHHHDHHLVLDFYRYSAYAGLDCHRLRTFYGEIAYIFFVAAWVFKRFMVFSASKSCKIGFKQSDLCTFCGEETENLTHLFLRCKYSKSFWEEFSQWLAQNTSNMEGFVPSEAILLGIVSE